MNPLELANELEIAQGNNNVDELIPEVITMLRQLHIDKHYALELVKCHEQTIIEKIAEIASLYYVNSMLKNRHNLQKTEIEHLKGLILALKMQVNGLKKASGNEK